VNDGFFFYLFLLHYIKNMRVDFQKRGFLMPIFFFLGHQQVAGKAFAFKPNEAGYWSDVGGAVQPEKPLPQGVPAGLSYFL
jgi:hypothetical protein